MDCGRFLRTDSCSLDRDRFDYVRVLIATSSLKIASMVEKLLIDGVLVEINIMEEWGFNIGEDACLFEDVDESDEENDHEDVPVNQEIGNNVNHLVDKIVDDLEEEELIGGHNSIGAQLDDPVLDTVDSSANVQDKRSPSVHEDSQAATSRPSAYVDNGEASTCENHGETEHEKEAQTSYTGINAIVIGNNEVVEPEITGQVHVVSCPNGVGRSAVSGPLSMEWLNDKNCDDAGIIFTPKKKVKRGGGGDTYHISEA